MRFRTHFFLLQEKETVKGVHKQTVKGRLELTAVQGPAVINHVRWNRNVDGCGRYEWKTNGTDRLFDVFGHLEYIYSYF